MPPEVKSFSEKTLEGGLQTRVASKLKILPGRSLKACPQPLGQDKAAS
jgi:hypothetical protein